MARAPRSGATAPLASSVVGWQFFDEVAISEDRAAAAGTPRLGSWPTMIVIASGDEPALTGGQELEMKPSRRGDDEDITYDQAARRGRWRSDAAIGPTTAADMIAIVELVVTLRCRLVPKIAYAVRAANAVVSPTSGCTPARPA
jgi:hypothetical protein